MGKRITPGELWEKIQASQRQQSLRDIQFDGPDDPHLRDGTAIDWDTEASTPPGSDTPYIELVLLAMAIIALLGLYRGWWLA